MKKVFVSLLALAGAVLLAAPAHAVTYQFLDDTPPDGVCTGSGTNVGNSYSCQAQGSQTTSLTVTAYSNTGSGGTFAAAKVGDYDDGTGNGDPEFDQYGYGVTTGTETSSGGQHALDNNGNLEFFLLSFNESIALTTVRAGWIQTDSDISVLAYTGSDVANAVSAATSSTASTLLNTGWDLVQNYSDIGTGEININSQAVSSSYWIISAYSNTFGSDNWSMGNDYLKLTKITGNFTCANSNDPSCDPAPPGVPEPASLALVGAALLGAFGGRRRALKAQKV
ncbi:MAG: PEP-CTERM sorting domain-containing protein [Rubrivivax sp.]|nr:PEP-CTERM sorting domain-containing protein [Rubrivivax sp.]